MAKNKIIYGGEVLIDLTGDTVTAASLAAGVTAHDRSGELITGTSTFDADTSDANAAASEILTGKSAYVGGSKVDGSMPNRGAIEETISTKDQVVTIPSGYHDGSGTVELDETEKDKLIAGNIKEGVELFGVTGTLAPAENVTAQAKTATPYTTAQTILPDDGTDYLSQVTVEAIAYTETENAYGTTVTIGAVAPTTP